MRPEKVDEMGVVLLGFVMIFGLKWFKNETECFFLN